MPPPSLSIHPPLLNSACPWATGLEELRAILISPDTGALTTRTCLIKGFDHQHANHQYLFFDPASSKPDKGVSSTPEPPKGHAENTTASLNSLGYSPIPLDGYLDFLSQLAKQHPDLAAKKTVIISVTGSIQDIRTCYELIKGASKELPFQLAMEVNLSCPNIPNAPPPAYDGSALVKYLTALPDDPAVPIGVKTPPYTHAGQFSTLMSALRGRSSTISFITATNTLGSCLVLDPDTLSPQLANLGIGGMAGSSLHPLALGNVSTIRRMLDEVAELRHVQIIGVGGVQDGAGYHRMRTVGAYAVAVGTALGKQGPDVFERIKRDIKGSW